MNDSDKALIQANSYKISSYLFLPNILKILVEWGTLTAENVKQVYK